MADNVPPCRVLLAIDPGTAKCGLAVVREGPPPETLCRLIVPTDSVPAQVAELREMYPEAIMVMGDATGGKALARLLGDALPESAACHLTPERGTSERARARYDRENPPRGWRRLIPAGLRTPPVPYDDYAAVILAEDWLTANPPPATPQRVSGTQPEPRP